MKKVYNFKSYDKKTGRNGHVSNKVKINKSYGKNMTMRDAVTVIKQINDSTPKNVNRKFYVIAETDIGNRTIKSKDEENIRADTLTEYLNGRVADESAFTKIISITIVMMQEKK